MKIPSTIFRLAITLFIFLAPMAIAVGVPHLMNIQGILTDDADTPVYDGIHMVDFSIYDVESDGAALWSESRAVTTTGGLFSIVLGEVNPIPASLFSGTDLWLGMALTGNPEMMPRQRLTAVPYVFRALNADSANFAFAVADDAISSSNIADGSIMLGDLGQNGATSGQVIKWNGSAWAPATDEGSGGGWVDDGSIIRLATSTDYVGIGTSTPQEKLHVSGDIRLGSSSDIAFGNDNTRIYATGGDMVVTADDDLHLQPDDDIYIRADGGDAWAHFDNGAQRIGIGTGTGGMDEKLHVENSGMVGRAFLQLQTSHASAWGETGIRFINPANRWHLRMDDYSNNNLPVEGSLALRSHNSGKEVMTWTNNGDVGIGDTSPDAKLDINGDLLVAGAYRGTISSSSGSDGASFPRPAYDSGWFLFYTGMDFPLTHNIGGDSSNYVVDLQFMHDGYMGVHNRGHGIDFSASTAYGAHWYGLTSSMITISPAPGSELHYVDSVRVRIWVIK